MLVEALLQRVGVIDTGLQSKNIGMGEIETGRINVSLRVAKVRSFGVVRYKSRQVARCVGIKQAALQIR